METSLNNEIVVVWSQMLSMKKGQQENGQGQMAKRNLVSLCMET
jgi:hypothetical protein